MAVNQNHIAMNVDHRLSTIEMKARLSTLWIFVLINMLFRDIHELFRPGLLEQMISGTVNGVQITDGVLLMGAILLEISILMVILSRILKNPLNRWANIAAGLVTMLVTVGNGITSGMDADDLFFASVEVIALLLIVWFAWRWREGDTLAINAVALQTERQSFGDSGG